MTFRSQPAALPTSPTWRQVRNGGTVRPHKSRNHGGVIRRQLGLNMQLSVDGGDNTDDYIGGCLQNFSPDSIQEFAVQTSQEYANIARTVGGAVK